MNFNESKSIFLLLTIICYFALNSKLPMSYIARTNISVDIQVHQALLSHLENGDRKIGKFTEAAIKEKIEKENKEKIHAHNQDSA